MYIFAGAQFYAFLPIKLLVGWFLFVASLIVTFSLLYANAQCRTLFFFFFSFFFSHLTEAFEASP